MYYPCRAMSVLLLGSLIACSAPSSTVSASSSDDPAGPIVVAHRGASAHAPEHTFAAYDLAVEMGADFIEQDLQLTRDGVLVIIHDDTLERTARGPREYCTGRVRDRTLEQLRHCEVGSWFNTAYPDLARAEYIGQSIPTLDEVFERYGTRVRYYVETKNPAQAPGMEEALLRTLDTHGLRRPASDDWQVLIQSFSGESLRRIHEMDPALPLVQLYRSRWPSWWVRLQIPRAAEYAVGIGPSHRHVNARLMEAARSHCLQVHPFTVNDRATMSRLLDLGTTGMFTDHPDLLATIRAERSLPSADNVSLAMARRRSCMDSTDH